MATAKIQSANTKKPASATATATKRAPARTAPAKRSPSRPSRPRSKAKPKKWRSRAVSRLIDAGNSVYCAQCDELIKFRARIRAEQIICNVYISNKWDRVEHYHSECYEDAKSPYGEPDKSP